MMIIGSIVAGPLGGNPAALVVGFAVFFLSIAFGGIVELLRKQKDSRR
jgi:hypothetical protein